MTAIGTMPAPPFPEQAQSKPGLDARMDPRPLNQARALRGSDKLLDQVAVIAVLFAREGANVAITHLPAEDEDAGNVKALVEQEGRRCLTISGDVKDSSFC